MLKLSKDANPNYVATVVMLGDPIKHPKADRLQMFVVAGNRVITDMSYSKGDLCIFFPLESKLNFDLLSRLNMFEDKNLNADNTKKGYVNNKCRVRAVKLREEPSMGLILHVDVISSILGTPVRFVVDEEFDTWNEIVICEKYVPAAKSVQGEPRVKTQRYQVKRFNKLVEGQFQLHADTTQLRKNMHKLSPEDIISITYKLHGTSWVVGNVLTNRRLSLVDRVARFFGAKIRETEYDYIYSSRSVVKNKFANSNPNHYYGTDLWGDIKDHLSGKIPAGFTLYGEAVGFTSTGGAIQKGYDYGYKARTTFLNPDMIGYVQDPNVLEQYEEGKHFGVYVYRITFTNYNGFKTELTWSQIKQYCQWFGLRHVPELFYGKAQDWGFPQDHWHANVLAKFESNFLEKDCHMCISKAPAEGVVVRKDDLLNFEAYKLKSFRFLEGETKALDLGEIDIETEQHEAGGDE